MKFLLWCRTLKTEVKLHRVRRWLSLGNLPWDLIPFITFFVVERNTHAHVYINKWTDFLRQKNISILQQWSQCKRLHHHGNGPKPHLMVIFQRSPWNISCFLLWSQKKWLSAKKRAISSRSPITGLDSALQATRFLWTQPKAHYT